MMRWVLKCTGRADQAFDTFEAAKEAARPLTEKGEAVTIDRFSGPSQGLPLAAMRSYRYDEEVSDWVEGDGSPSP
jgi:hypothetical protein